MTETAGTSMQGIQGHSPNLILSRVITVPISLAATVLIPTTFPSIRASASASRRIFMTPGRVTMCMTMEVLRVALIALEAVTLDLASARVTMRAMLLTFSHWKLTYQLRTSWVNILASAVLVLISVSVFVRTMLTLCTEVDLDLQIETVVMCEIDEVRPLDASPPPEDERGLSDVARPASIDVTIVTTLSRDDHHHPETPRYLRHIIAGTHLGDHHPSP